MREKKVRGMKRKTQQIIKEMNANTQSFPENVSATSTCLYQWDLSVAQNMRTIGFKEVITDDDEVSYEGERWFMGELDDIK